MELFWKILNGPEAGKTLKIRPGMTIGRTQANLIIDDPKVSSLHAIVDLDHEGNIILQDQGSKNGLKVAGEKLTSFRLEHDIIVTIGSTELQVIDIALKAPQPKAETTDIDEHTATDSTFVENTSTGTEAPTQSHMGMGQGSITLEKTTGRPPTSSSGATPPLPKEKQAPREPEWNEILEKFSQKALTKMKNRAKPIKAFNPAVQLDFVRGVQTDTTWILGYGPRLVGSEQYELPIFEKNAPAKCFELKPISKGVEFKTDHPKKVLLNDKATKSEVLKDGDTIIIENTKIRVRLIE